MCINFHDYSSIGVARSEVRNIHTHMLAGAGKHWLSFLYHFYSQSLIKLSKWVSLYTNVPLKETINIIASYLYPKDAVSCLPFPEKSFIKLMKIATEGLFMYNYKFYTQTDGVAMGNPLGPMLANFFLAHLETTKIIKFSGQHPKIFLRYVDDIFVLFDDEAHINPFFRYLNQLHKNLKLTCEEVYREYQNSGIFNCRDLNKC